MKIGLAQISCDVEIPESNYDKMLSYIRHAAESGCKVIVFPEMCDTGYLPSKIIKNADKEGTAIKELELAASKSNIWIVAGLSEVKTDKVYNSIAVITPEGVTAKRYHKIHLFKPAPIQEDEIFSAGSAMADYDLAGAKWGLSICYDLRFPEIYREYALRGCKVLTNCTAWPQVRAGHWETLTRARAIENQCYFIGANRVGQDGDFSFCGKSSIISPYGDIVAMGSGKDEELVVGELDLSQVDSYRNAIPILKDRRPEVYC